MSDYYQKEDRIVQEMDNRRKILYRSAKEIEVPSDYFEEIRKGLSHELKSEYVDLSACVSTHQKMMREVQEIRSEIESIDSRVRKIEGVETVIEEQDMSEEEAKPLIENFVREYLETHEDVYPSDASEELRLRYDLVVKIFAILESEGKLRKKGD